MGTLQAVVQDVPAREFSEEALQERLLDRDELERCARVHHEVVSAAAGLSATIPLPLATMYLSDERVRQALHPRESRFHTVFDRIEGRVEWGVKVYMTAPLDPSQARGSEVTAGPVAPGSGRAYLDRVRGRNQAREDRQSTALRAAERVDAALRGVSAAARRLRTHGTEPTGERSTQLLNAAYLLDEGSDETLAATLHGLRADPDVSRVRIEVTGPWVPYSFAATEGGDGDN